MTVFLSNLMLAIIWAGLTGNFSPANLAFGFLLGYLILSFSQLVVGPTQYYVKMSRIVRTSVFFIWELLKANIRVARDVVLPIDHLRPGVVAIPLTAKTDAEITALANMITLTPGTLSLDVSPDRRTLYVHVISVTDPDEVRRSIKDGLERRVLEVLR